MSTTCDNAVYEEVKVESSRSRKSFDIHENKCYGNVTTTATNECKENNYSYSKVVIMAFVIVFALLLGTAGACVAFALQITTLKSETASLKMASSSLLEEVGHQLNRFGFCIGSSLGTTPHAQQPGPLLATQFTRCMDRLTHHHVLCHPFFSTLYVIKSTMPIAISHTGSGGF